MRYELPCGGVLKTENAAKPAIQASRYLSSFISQLSPVHSSFDYGCGKLRYMAPILSASESLTVVDSEIQIGRTQSIFGKAASVREVARHSNRVRVANTVDFSNGDTEFDRGFCINVLSAVPFVLVRRQILALIRQKLKPGACCLFVVQYRNSEFGRMRRQPNARPWLDGFLMNSLRGLSFYGLIAPRHLRDLVVEAGFDVVECRLDEGRVYLTARSPRKPEVKMEVVSESGFAVRWMP